MPVFKYVYDSDQQENIQISTLATLIIQDSIHILRYLQNKIATARKLDIDSDNFENGNAVTGETSFIVIDRHRILETALENVSSRENLRLTPEVQFCD